MSRHNKDQKTELCRNNGFLCRENSGEVPEEECHDTTKLCHDIKWQTKRIRQNKLVATKVFMLRQIFQRMTRSRQEICRDIKFRSQHSKARRLCHDKEVL